MIFTSDGTIDEFFGDFVELGIDMLVMEPTSDLRRFGELYGDRCGMAGGIDCRFLTSAGHVEIEQYMATCSPGAKSATTSFWPAATICPPAFQSKKHSSISRCTGNTPAADSS